MDRVFVDASVLFSAAYRVDSKLKSLWKRKKVHLITSVYAAEEAGRNLEDEAQLLRLYELLRSMEIIGSTPAGPLPDEVRLPEKDAPILLAAIQAQCTHLVTSDKRHFGPYFGRMIAGVRILPPGEYLHGSAQGRPTG